MENKEMLKNGFPKSSKAGDRWADEANEDRDTVFQPSWSFDCNYKLDFDGPLLNITSRFRWYTDEEGVDKYGGDVEVYLGPLDGEPFKKREFVANSLPELKMMVEAYEDELKEKIKQALSTVI